MALDYSAYLVTPSGEIAHISTVHTQKTARDLVDYWKRSSVWEKSFYCKKDNIPPKYILGVRKYWEDYEASHPVEEKEFDPDALPFM